MSLLFLILRRVFLLGTLFAIEFLLVVGTFWFWNSVREWLGIVGFVPSITRGAFIVPILGGLGLPTLLWKGWFDSCDQGHQVWYVGREFLLLANLILNIPGVGFQENMWKASNVPKVEVEDPLLRQSNDQDQKAAPKRDKNGQLCYSPVKLDRR